MPIETRFLSAIRSESTSRIRLGQASSSNPVTRRNTAVRFHQKTAYLQMVASGEDLFAWREVPNIVPGLGKRQRGGSSTDGDDTISFARLAPSEVTGFLSSQDAWLTPQLGLFRWTADHSLVPAKFPKEGKALLLVHGTFSSGHENVWGQCLCVQSSHSFGKSVAQRLVTAVGVG